jgi:hypothetical protein
MKKATTATPEQIEEWKKKHGSIFELTVEDKSCLVRKPTLKELSAASAVGQKDPFAFNRVILTNCWLAGDEEIKTNDDYFLAASGQLGAVIEVKEAAIKKL